METTVIQYDRGIVVEPSRQVPIAAEFDVVVAGGGMAGFGAALGAARQGSKTLVVERHGILGGAATALGMNTWNCPLEHISGAANELAGRLIERGYAWSGPMVPFDPEEAKQVQMEMLLEAGVQFLLYAWVTEPIVIADRIRGLIVESKSGRQAILAKAVVDATGDGDVAASAGCPVVKGREEDGKMRPVTVLFRLAGIDLDALQAHCRTDPQNFTANPAFHVMSPETGIVRISGFFKEVAEARARGELQGDINYLRFEGIDVERGIMTVNSSRVYDIDGTDMWDITRGELAARRQNRELYQFITRHIPGCHNAYIIGSSSTLGVRETRRIRGDHVLTEEDCFAERTYPDAVGRIWRFHVRGGEWHSPDGGEGAPHDMVYRDAIPDLYWFEVPYGVVVPQKIEGLTVGGRIISQTHRADMWTRGQYACINTGQVAGTAAALAIQADTVPRNLKVSVLQRALIKQGMDIGEIEADLRPNEHGRR
jgi:hypothetical protein